MKLRKTFRQQSLHKEFRNRYKTDNGIFLDPSNETAQQLISDGVKEIAENYDVDGIQFDDYFYPTEDESFDKKQYEAYIEKYGKENSMSLDNWRMQNVNTLICKVYRTIKVWIRQLSSAYHRKAI